MRKDLKIENSRFLMNHFIDKDFMPSLGKVDSFIRESRFQGIFSKAYFLKFQGRFFVGREVIGPPSLFNEFHFKNGLFFDLGAQTLLHKEDSKDLGVNRLEDSLGVWDRRDPEKFSYFEALNLLKIHYPSG